MNNINGTSNIGIAYNNALKEARIKGKDAFGIYNSKNLNEALDENNLDVKMMNSVEVNANLLGEKETLANSNIVIVNGENKEGVFNGRSKQVSPHFLAKPENENNVPIGFGYSYNYLPQDGREYIDYSETNMQ